MKKYILVILMFLCASVYSQETSSLDIKGMFKVSFDLGGTHKLTDVLFSDSLSGEQDINTGYTISAEFTTKIIDYVSLGAGVSYQFRRGAEKNDSLLALDEPGIYYGQGTFGYIPVYAILELTPYESETITANIIGHAGFNLFQGEDAFKGDLLLGGGLYYGFGVNVEMYERYLLDVMYKVNQGDVSHAEDNLYESKYSYISLALGVRL